MWRGFCEKLRDCGRDGNLFFVSFLVVLLSGLFWANGGAMLLGGFVLLNLLRALMVLLEHRERYERLGRLPPLPERDMQRARARLLNSRRTR